MILKTKYHSEWQTKFAWLPVYVDRSQNLVWLRKYYARWISVASASQKVSELPPNLCPHKHEDWDECPDCCR